MGQDFDLFFHEDCMNIIMNDLIELMNPAALKYGANAIEAEIDPYTNTADREQNTKNGRTSDEES